MASAAQWDEAKKADASASEHASIPSGGSGMAPGALGRASSAMPAQKFSGLLKGSARGAKGMGKPPGKAQMLQEIQKGFGNAYAQKVIQGYQKLPTGKKGAAAKSAGPPGKEVNAPLPPEKLALHVAEAEAEPGGAVASPPGAKPASKPGAMPGSRSGSKPGGGLASKAGLIPTLAKSPVIPNSGTGANPSKSPLGKPGNTSATPGGKAGEGGDKIPSGKSKGPEGAPPPGGPAAAGKGSPKDGEAVPKPGGKFDLKPGAGPVDPAMAAMAAMDKAGGKLGSAPGGMGSKGGNSAHGAQGAQGSKGGEAAGKAGAADKGGKVEKEKPAARADAGGGRIAGASGGGAGGGGGGGSGGGGGAGAKSPKSPDEDKDFQKVKKRAGQQAKKVAQHEPAGAKAAQAQGAAVGPANEVQSKAEANQAGQMDAAKAKPFDRAAFKAALMAKITALTPKNLEEADEFKSSGKVGEVKGAVNSEVEAGKDNSQGDIEAKTKESPNTGGIEGKTVTPMQPEPAGPRPGDIGAPGAAPKPKTAAETSLKEGSKKLDQSWKETELDDQAVAKSNEDSFKKGLAEKNKAQKDAETRPLDYRQKEEGLLEQSQAQAEGTADSKLDSMHAKKSGAMAKVAEGQAGAKSKDEREREKVASDIQAIFDATKNAVENKLKEVETGVTQTFDSGAEAARVAFENHVDQRMRAYKKDRYGGWGGGLLWAKDKLFGMPDEVNDFYTEGRELYLSLMDATIDKVAEKVETGLTAAKDLIAKGKAKVDGYVAGLEPGLRKMGQEEAGKFADQFSSLEDSINDKQGQLVDALAQKYVANLKKLDERIDEMKAANKGLVDAAIGAIKAIIAAIIKIKNLLLNVLAKAASVIGKIIKNPIGFLGNMVAAVKGGIMGFKERIGTHLQEGLMSWLLGAMGSVGITMPATFDIKGIMGLVMQILGLTYANIRSRAVTIVGEPVVKGMETAAGLFKTLVTEGPGAVWDEIKGQVGDVKEMIISGVKDWVITKLIIAGVTWLISMLNPASAFLKACKMIYDVVMFFVQRASQIIAFINAIIDSVTAIASGAVGAASAAIEGALAKSIPVVLGFLASLLGLNGLSDKIKSIIEKIRAPINKAIDWVINKAVKLVKTVGNAIFGKGGKDRAGADVRTPAEKQRDLAAAAAAVRQLDPKLGRRRTLAALERIKGQFRLTTLTGTPDSGGRLKVNAAVNPEMRFEVADYDDALLESLGSGFEAAVKQLSGMDAAKRKKSLVGVFQTNIRQFHTGVIVKVAGPDNAKVVTANMAPWPSPIKVGTYDANKGEGAVVDEVAIRAATMAGAAAVRGLAPKSTAPQGRLAFEAAFKGRMPHARLQYVPWQEQGITMRIETGPGQTKDLGLIMFARDSVLTSLGRRGPQERFKHKVNGQEFVLASEGVVQRFVWRALSEREGQLMTAKFEPVDNTLSLPSRPAKPGFERQRKATDEVTHATNANIASDFSSATTIEEARIVNRRNPEIQFRHASGSIKIDLFQMDPQNITVGARGGTPTLLFTDPRNMEANKDVVATREVFLKGGIPAAAIAEWSKGA